MEKVIDKVSNCLKYIVALLLVILVILATLQVITRYFISVQIIWIEEVSIYIVAWLAALGVAWMWLKQSHIKMDVLGFILPEKVLHIMDYIINIVAVIVSIGVIRVGHAAIEVNSGYVLSVIGMDEGMKYYPVFTAGIALLIASILVLAAMIAKDRKE